MAHMAERLSAYKATGQGVENPFRDSMVTNFVKLVVVMPRLNVTGDPELEQLTSELRASLLVDPGELRTSEKIRADTMQASRIARQMSAYVAGYQLSAVASSPLPTTTSVKPRFFRNCRTA